VILIVTHDLGGGTDRHIRELAIRRAGSALYLGLQPFGGDRVRLSCIDDDLGPELHLRMPRDRSLLVRFLQSAGVERVHVHHVLGLPLDIQELVNDLSVPFDFTAHDYHTVCPKIRLIRVKRYCGEPDERGCNECLRSEPIDSVTDIGAWRATHAWLLTGAERVFCPSVDAAERMKRRFPDARLTVVPHENDIESYPEVVALPLRHKEPLRFVVIGALSKEKGADLLVDTARSVSRLNLPVTFTLIGFCDGVADAQRKAQLVSTGPYQEKELPALLEQARPHIAWFPALWPETFSYTLSAAFAAQLPVVVPNIGAFPERVSGRPWSWIVPWDMKAKELAVFFANVRVRHFVRGRAPVADGTNQYLA
jgi:glycosyltransferase involved in cell wall biosynthesis